MFKIKETVVFPLKRLAVYFPYSYKIKKKTPVNSFCFTTNSCSGVLVTIKTIENFWYFQRTLVRRKLHWTTRRHMCTYGYRSKYRGNIDGIIIPEKQKMKQLYKKVGNNIAFYCRRKRNNNLILIIKYKNNVLFLYSLVLKIMRYSTWVVNWSIFRVTTYLFDCAILVFSCD